MKIKIRDYELNSEMNEVVQSRSRTGERLLSQEVRTKTRESQLSATKASHQFKELNARLRKANRVSGTKAFKCLDFRSSERVRQQLYYLIEGVSWIQKQGESLLPTFYTFSTDCWLEKSWEMDAATAVKRNTGFYGFRYVHIRATWGRELKLQGAIWCVIYHNDCNGKSSITRLDH